MLRRRCLLIGPAPLSGPSPSIRWRPRRRDMPSARGSHMRHARPPAEAAGLPSSYPKVHNQRMFDWNDLRYFLAVARHGSTLAAAKALRLSQSTVHRRLAELEKRMQRRVVIRHATGYRLTEFGKALQPLAEQVEEAVARLDRHLTATD